MGHPFGDLLSQHLHRKHGLSQAKLAAGILQDPSIIGKMCKGERLTGPQARERVVAVVNWLHANGVLDSAAEAGALLAAAGMSPLCERIADEHTLLQQMEAPAPAKAPPLMSPESKTNLPAPLTTFVGRSQELADVAQAISTHRLLTLTGAGGVGKTRLAIEAGIRLVWGGNGCAFADGIWMVDLAALSQGALIAPTIARLFKLPESAGWELESLQEYFGNKELLLILDNCEHLLDACAGLAETLLHRGWRLRILATSREELRIPGEVVYPVQSLVLPGSAAHKAADVLSSPAAQLFVERMGVAPSVRKTTDEDAAIIAHICRQLDGIPLALELAAPLARSLSLVEISSRLDDQMAILTNNYRTAIPRHQTMHSALVWSYRLLAPAEQRLLAQVSVFAGGWTPEACEAVCGGDSDPSVLPVLHELVAKSCVVLEHVPGDRRYRLLEPVRQFARTQLAARGEEAATQRRHARYFLALAEQMGTAHDTPREREWLQRLEPERNNLRAVNEWALANDEAEFAHRLNGHLFAFWIYCSSLAEASQWLEAALALGKHDAHRARTPAALSAEVMALHAAGYAAVSLLDYARAMARFERELALCTVLDDQKGVATALRGCGFTAMLCGELARAQVCDERALSISTTIGDRWGVAWALYDLGYLALVRGDLDAAQRLLEEALPQLREQGVNFGAYRALLALGHVMRGVGEWESARRYYGDALRLQQVIHYTLYAADGLEALASVAAHDGDPRRAATLYGAASAHREAFLMQHWLHQVAGYERDLALARGLLDNESWDHSWNAGRALTLDQATAIALTFA